ncbi:hypothetical protein [Sphingobium yanoikuyae]|nr:hypothetical protein [Sphingobium yanoikuyae]MDH2150150.1 hypothetical protein [Sphingobium yanoikuyae]
MSVRIAKILSAFAVVWQAQSLQGYGLMIKPFETPCPQSIHRDGRV